MRLISITIVLGLAPFLALGVFLVGKGIGNARQARASVHWPKAEAVVSRSDATSSTSRGSSDHTASTSYSADLEIKYQVNGKEYTTTARHFGQTEGSSDSSEAELLRLRYPAGRRVTVSYNPANPSIAVAEPGFQSELLWLPGAGVFLIAPAVMFLALYFGRDSAGMFDAGILLFGSIFAALGLIGLVYGGIQIARAAESGGWPTTPGKIVYGKIDVSEAVTKADDDDETGRRETSFGPRLIYQYDVGGRTYYSNQRRWGQLFGADEDWAAEIAERYPPGAAMPVAYSPENPQLAVLEPGMASEAYWLPGAGLASCLFGLAVMIFARRALSGVR